MQNTVNETMFPDGSDLCTQILDLSKYEGEELEQGTNEITGWEACETEASKAINYSMSSRYKYWMKSLEDKQIQRRNRRELVK